jgi:hypothetical protein
MLHLSKHPPKKQLEEAMLRLWWKTVRQRRLLYQKKSVIHNQYFIKEQKEGFIYHCSDKEPKHSENRIESNRIEIRPSSFFSNNIMKQPNTPEQQSL